MSLFTSYLTYTIAIILNSIVATLGMIASIGILWALMERLRTSSLGREDFQRNDADATRSRTRSVNKFWDAVLGCLTALTSIGYAGWTYYFWIKLDSVMEAVFLGTITIIGISVGVAVVAGGFVYFGRGAGWAI